MYKEKGQSIAEYALILILVAILILVITKFGTWFFETFKSVTCILTTGEYCSSLILFEITEDTYVSTTNTIGEIDAEYPIWMSPGSSDSIIVKISIPESYASLEPPTNFVRINIPSDTPQVLGELSSFNRTIFISDTMRVELSSPAFEIEKLHPSTQKIDVNNFGEPTIWAWNIVSPDKAGFQTLTIRIFLGDIEIPSWFANLQIEVIDFSSTPSLADAFTRITVRLIDNSPILVITTILAVIIVFLVGFDYYRTYNKRVLQDSPWEPPPPIRASAKQSNVQKFNLNNIRTLLIEGFTNEELRRLCYDEPDFRPVYEQLSQGMSKAQVIDQLIEYTERQELIEILLTLAKVHNPGKYEKHQPYYVSVLYPYYNPATSPTRSSGTHGKSQRATKGKSN